jgi:hypothetical protein
MSLFGWISQAPKITNTACDLAKDISSGVDVMFYTEEEKSQARQAAYDTWLNMMKVLGPSSARGISRRVIAIIVMLTCVFLTFVGVFAAFVGEKLLVETVLAFFGHWWKVATVVTVFYFGPHLVNAVKGKD